MTHSRRLGSAIVAVLGSVALSGMWPTEAAAALLHGTVDVTVHTDGAGAVWTSVRWNDGHLVTGPVTAILVATSAEGARVGPVALRAVPDVDGTLSYAGKLQPGQWQVAVDVATPAVGHCDAVVQATPPGSPTATPTDTVCAAPPPAQAAAGAEAGEIESPPAVPVLVISAVVVAAACAVAGGVAGAARLARWRGGRRRA